MAALLAGCGPRPAAEVGKELFSDPALSTAGSNGFACATCHVVDIPPPRVLPGYAMNDVTRRPSYWGGTVPSLLEAVNQCMTQFMRGRELTADEDNSLALKAYLDELSPSASAPALPLTVVRNISDVMSGDGTAGDSLYHQSCANCHGEPHTGEGQINKQASVIPDATLMTFGTDPKKGTRPITIEKVRHGKFYGIGGNMAPFSLEALSDDQLGALLGYLEMFGLPPSVR